MTLQALFCDLDGTLIDSEPLWLAVERDVMDWLGGPWGPEHQQVVLGGTLAKCVAYMRELSGRDDVPGDEIGARMLDLMADRLAAGVRLNPGAKELLAEANAAGVPVALVTSTVRRLADSALRSLGPEHFAVTVAGDEVAHTKPHPEPYLKAARELGVDPARCVVLEDSPTGIAAGEAAGCAVVAVRGLAPVPAAPGRTLVTSLADVDLARLRELVAVRVVLP